MEFSRQEYGSGLPFPTLGKLADPLLIPGSEIYEARGESHHSEIRLNFNQPQRGESVQIKLLDYGN